MIGGRGHVCNWPISAIWFAAVTTGQFAFTTGSVATLTRVVLQSPYEAYHLTVSGEVIHLSMFHAKSMRSGSMFFGIPSIHPPSVETWIFASGPRG